MGAVCPYKYVHSLFRNILGKDSWQGPTWEGLHSVLVETEDPVWLWVEYELLIGVNLKKHSHFGILSFSMELKF